MERAFQAEYRARRTLNASAASRSRTRQSSRRWQCACAEKRSRARRRDGAAARLPRSLRSNPDQWRRRSASTRQPRRPRLRPNMPSSFVARWPRRSIWSKRSALKTTSLREELLQRWMSSNVGPETERRSGYPSFHSLSLAGTGRGATLRYMLLYITGRVWAGRITISSRQAPRGSSSPAGSARNIHHCTDDSE